MIVTETGGSGGSFDVGQGAANTGAGATGVNDPTTVGGAFSIPSAGSSSAGTPGLPGTAGTSPFGTSGGPSSFGTSGGPASFGTGGGF